MRGFDPTDEEIARHQERVRAGRGKPAGASRAHGESVQTEAKAKRQRVDREHEEQNALFQWADTVAGLYPELALMFAIPNGGLRNKATAGKLRAEGCKRGVPDLCLAVPRGGFHALYIELKAEGGKTTDAQEWWLDALSRQGYRTAVCFGWEAAKDLIEEYLKV